MDDYLKVTVKSRKKVLLEGLVYSLTSFNVVGEFDVLPQHANMITLLKEKIIVDKGRPTQNEIKFDSALMSVMGNEVSVYVDI